MDGPVQLAVVCRTRRVRRRHVVHRIPHGTCRVSHRVAADVAGSRNRPGTRGHRRPGVGDPRRPPRRSVVRADDRYGRGRTVTGRLRDRVGRQRPARRARPSPRAAAADRRPRHARALLGSAAGSVAADGRPVRPRRRRAHQPADPNGDGATCVPTRVAPTDRAGRRGVGRRSADRGPFRNGGRATIGRTLPPDVTCSGCRDRSRRVHPRRALSRTASDCRPDYGSAAWGRPSCR